MILCCWNLALRPKYILKPIYFVNIVYRYPSPCGYMEPKLMEDIISPCLIRRFRFLSQRRAAPHATRAARPPRRRARQPFSFLNKTKNQVSA